jgi:hypothetical protein
MFLHSDCWRIGINHFFPPPTIRMAIEPGVWGLAGFTLWGMGGDFHHRFAGTRPDEVAGWI